MINGREARIGTEWRMSLEVHSLRLTKLLRETRWKTGVLYAYLTLWRLTTHIGVVPLR